VHKHEAVTSVFFDRVIGVVGLVAMSGIVVLANWRNPALAHWGRVIAVAVVVLVVGAGTYFSHRMRRLLRLERIVSVLPLAAHLQRIDRALFAFRHRVRRLLACLALTAVLQAVAIVALFVSGWALGMVHGRALSTLPVYLAYTPVCFLAGALPLGVMEATFIKLFADAARLGTPEAALSLSLLARFIQLVWALPGAIVVLQAGRPQPLAQGTLDSAEPELPAPPQPG